MKKETIEKKIRIMKSQRGDTEKNNLIEEEKIMGVNKISRQNNSKL